MCRAFRDDDASSAHRFNFRFRVALATRDDGPGVAHAAAFGGGAARDEACGGLPAALFTLIREELRRFFFGRATDFADHDDRGGFGICKEHFEHVDMFGAFDRVATNAHCGGLAKAEIGGLLDGLIGEGARARNNADGPPAVDVAGHDADLAGVRRDHAGAVRADQARFGMRQRAFDTHHVKHRDAFGDSDDQFHFSVDGFEDRVRREGRWHVDHRSIGRSDSARFVDRVENGQTEVVGAAFAGGHAADHLRAIGNRLFGVEGALAAGEALADDLGVLINEDCHLITPSRP